jgi:Zn-dependent M16 (insulinase) family peptidase
LKATVSFINQALKGVSKTHQVDLLKKYQAVSKQDVLAALRKHFLPLFDSASSVAVVVTAPSKVDQIHDGLQQMGYVVEQQTLDLELGNDSEGGESEGETDSIKSEHLV